jgi:hypothetical protein
MREFWWTAIAQYQMGNGFLRVFHFGSVKAVGDEHARKLLIELWDTISPHPAPEIVGVMKGRLVLQDE